MEDLNKEQMREKFLGEEEVRASISNRAYEIYLERGEMPGSAEDDWLRAEDEILESLIEAGSLYPAAERAQFAADILEAAKPQADAPTPIKSSSKSKSTASRKLRGSSINVI